MKDIINNMTSEEYIKLFDFATDGKYKPEAKDEKKTDEEILKELGL